MVMLLLVETLSLERMAFFINHGSSCVDIRMKNSYVYAS